jgi:hypothetical protein
MAKFCFRPFCCIALILLGKSKLSVAFGVSSTWADSASSTARSSSSSSGTMADLFNPDPTNWNAVVGEADRAFRRGVQLDKVSHGLLLGQDCVLTCSNDNSTFNKTEVGATSCCKWRVSRGCYTFSMLFRPRKLFRTRDESEQRGLPCCTVLYVGAIRFPE